MAGIIDVSRLNIDDGTASPYEVETLGSVYKEFKDPTVGDLHTDAIPTEQPQKTITAIKQRTETQSKNIIPYIAVAVAVVCVAVFFYKKGAK